MRMHVFLLADTYADKGYRVTLIDPTDEWSVRHYNNTQDAMYLHDVEITMPKISKLVEFGMTHVEKMKSDLAESTQEAKERISNYQSKFILLDAPEVTEMS